MDEPIMKDAIESSYIELAKALRGMIEAHKSQDEFLGPCELLDHGMYLLRAIIDQQYLEMQRKDKPDEKVNTYREL